MFLRLWQRAKAYVNGIIYQGTSPATFHSFVPLTRIIITSSVQATSAIAIVFVWLWVGLQVEMTWGRILCFAMVVAMLPPLLGYHAVQWFERAVREKVLMRNNMPS
jgi:hypothetical protein